MKFVAIYDSHSGEISALCALPTDPNAPTAGMRMRAGQKRAEFDAPAEFLTKPEGPERHALIHDFIKNSRIEASETVTIVDRPASKR
jgi:hypothetical protein